jgi:queuosine precursor transporter
MMSKKGADIATHPKQTSRYIIILAMLYAISFMFPMMLAYRMVQLGSLLLPGGTLFFAASYFLGDVIAEVYGYQIARQLVWSAIFCQLLLGALIMLVLHLPSPSYWHQEPAFDLVLGHAMRYALASTAGNFFGEFTNIYLITKFKVFLKGKHFWLRSLGSSFIGEAALTLVVFFITFIGLTSSHHVIKLMLSAYIFKMLFSLLGVGPSCILVAILKKKEKLDVYDYATNFNPFKFSIEIKPKLKAHDSIR